MKDSFAGGYIGSLIKNNCLVSGKITQLEGSHPVREHFLPVASDDAVIEWNNEGSRGIYELNMKGISGNPDAMDMFCRFRLKEGSLPQANIGISFKFSNWSRDNYVLLPAAVYNGNRFQARHINYSPKLERPEDIGPDITIIITDVPRLNIGEGLSSLQQMTRDLAVPCVGFYSPAEGKGFIILAEQCTELGDSCITIIENADRTEAVIALEAPGVRHDYKYRICDSGVPSDDRGYDFQAGDSVTIKLRFYCFRCQSIQELFDYFVKIRKDVSGCGSLYNEIPFSAAWQIQEDKYNRQNWVEKYGYYSVGMRENILQNWQLGWTGGILATYPLLFQGTELSKARALKNLEFIFQEAGISPSGFFHTCGDGERWCADGFRKEHTKSWNLIRKNGDALYYIMKQVMLLEKYSDEISACGNEKWTSLPEIKQHFPIPESWKRRIKGCADAFVRLWDIWGQLGQFVHVDIGDIIVGGSTSGGIVPAALTLAWKYFVTEDYLRVAKEAALQFYERDVKSGVTTGGPGDACQCPDSESAFGLLEAYVVLYEETGDSKWLGMARELANQCISWCMSYDFKFPEESTFGKLNMHTLGSVYANVQNKHSAPGICTHSGLSLLKLYRATGEALYLEVIKELAHNLPQYLSREDRQVGGLQPGWMNERVNTSDWLEPVGEIFNGSCWCEVSNMLTYVEIPGIYLHSDTGFLCGIDHVEAKVLERNSDGLTLSVINRTKFDASVKLFIEKSTDMSKPMGQNALFGCKVINLKAGEKRIIEVRPVEK